jgi:hypothetical protein
LAGWGMAHASPAVVPDFAQSSAISLAAARSPLFSPSPPLPHSHTLTRTLLTTPPPQPSPPRPHGDDARHILDPPTHTRTSISRLSHLRHHRLPCLHPLPPSDRDADASASATPPPGLHLTSRPARSSASPRRPPCLCSVAAGVSRIMVRSCPRGSVVVVVVEAEDGGRPWDEEGDIPLTSSASSASAADAATATANSPSPTASC